MTEYFIADPEELSDLDKQVLIQFVCLNGFKNLSLLKASVLTEKNISFFYRNWETDQALRMWLAAQTHQEFYRFLTPLTQQSPSNFTKGHLADILDRYLDFISTNEVYYRFCLWGYLENDPSIQGMCQKAQLDFFQMIQVLFKKSKPQAQEKSEFYAYLFISLWKTYAGLVWCDSKTLENQASLEKIKSQLKAFIIESVFESY